jgi:argininosuccinate lyase
LLVEPIAVDTAVGSTNVMAGATATITPRKEVMLKNLRDGFTTATDLADALVRSHGLSFRQAHDIIVDVVLRALEEGKKAEEITPEMIADASERAMGKRITVTGKELAAALNPYKNLTGRDTVGGPAPASVKKSIKGLRANLAKQEKRREFRRSNIKSATAKLVAAEKNL